MELKVLWRTSGVKEEEEEKKIKEKEKENSANLVKEPDKKKYRKVEKWEMVNEYRPIEISKKNNKEKRKNDI